MRKMLKLLPLILLLNSCVHLYDDFEWREVKQVGAVKITKVERKDAAEYCSKLYGKPLLACVDPGMNWENCKIVAPPNSPAAIGHEAAHCFGYAH